MSKINFIEKLNKRLEFGEDVTIIDILEDYFELITYDEEIARKLINRIVRIIKVILEDRTFEFIGDEDNYLEYITIINLPFFKDRIDWGTSIRGAWFIEKEEMIDIITQIDELNLKQMKGGKEGI